MQLHSIKFNHEVKTQKKKGRVWRELKLSDSITSFKFWGGVRIDVNNNVYCWDYDYKLSKFSPTGELLVKIGEGKGKGPGEFTLPMDMDIDKSGRVWIYDAGLGLIQIFDRNGRLYKLLRIQSMASKLRVLDGGRFVILKAVPFDCFFELYDTNGVLIRKFGCDLIDQQSRFPIAFTGDIEVYNGNLFLTFHYFGFLICYDVYNFNLKYVIETLDKNVFPRVFTFGKGREGGMKIAEDSDIASFDVRVFDGKILIRSGSGLKRRETVMDFYSAQDGEYLFSYRIQKHGFIYRDFFYEIRDTIIVKWRFYDGGQFKNK